MPTIREETYRLLRALNMRTIFGNPGSTEEPLLKDFPPGFTYVLGLQEASVVAMADGYAQAMKRPALVNLHTAPGVGNAMGAIVGAWHNKTPLVITAGQQTREMLLLEPWLTNLDATVLPRPYVKWSYEVARAEDVPAALMRAYATALQPPMGPVFVSIPMDDWDKPAERETPTRQISARFAPDPDMLRSVADALSSSRNPALIFGAGVDRSQGWDAAIGLAEKLRAPVFAAPGSERCGFPEDHPQYQGGLPFAIEPLSEKLEGYDVALLIGAPAFRYYPYIPGEYLPKGTRLLHITDDPNESSRAPVGDALLGDAAIACAQLTDLVATATRPMPKPMPAMPTPEPVTPMTPAFLFHELAQAKTDDTILVDESPSNLKALHSQWRVTRPNSFFTMASGGLGFGLPAAVGIALAERESGRNRRVLAIIGDGSFHYSVQALYTAAEYKLPVTFVIPRNEEYAILKSFAKQEKTPGVPGLDLPDFDLVTIAKGYGCAGQRVAQPGEVANAVRAALQGNAPTVIEVPITSEPPPLL